VNFLSKPFQAAKLAQTVRHCLDDGTTAGTPAGIANQPQLKDPRP
jgi:hypothetical protein